MLSDVTGYIEMLLLLFTGSSQMLKSLVAAKNIDWSKVVCFHLDEYIGIDESHNASFVRYTFLQHVLLSVVALFCPRDGIYRL